MMWYDTNLNPIEPSDNYGTYIHIQKPHNRTLRFVNEFKTLTTLKFIHESRRFKLPWFVFIYKKIKIKIDGKHGIDIRVFNAAISPEMPTLDSELYYTYLPNVHGSTVCVNRMSAYYDMKKIQPQDYVDYFWQSKFENVESLDLHQDYLENPSKYVLCHDMPTIRSKT